MKVISNLKRQIIKNLKGLVTPHVWQSGYVGVKLFTFAPISGRDTRSMGRVFNQDLTCCQGFYTEGIIDAVGGGCACYPFESFCLEDLIAIERWVSKNLQKEVIRTKQYRNRR